MRNKTSYNKVILVGIVVGVIYWILESYNMVFTFGKDNFIQQLFSPDPHELWMRSVTLVVIIIFAVYAQRVVTKLKRTENRLIGYKSHLEKLVEKRTAELTKANRLLQTEMQKRVDFTRLLVHELKTPLTPMLGASDILVNNLEDEELGRIAKNIHRGAHNLNNRINDLTDVAKGEMGTLQLRYEKVDIGQMLKEIEDYVLPEVEKRKLTLVSESPDYIPTLLADGDRLRQVILNLVSNALKFTPAKGRIDLKAKIQDTSLVVEVKDTGSGIAKKDQKWLFMAYYQIRTGQEPLSGLGLGLPLSKMLVELHGGQIWVESRKGKGSIFSFSIPLKIKGILLRGDHNRSGK